MRCFYRGNTGSTVCRAVAMVLLLAAVWSCSSSAPAEPEGFRGMKWGADIKDLQGLTLMAEDGNFKYYQNPSDKLLVDDVPVEAIIYGFFKNRFYNVTIRYRTRENFPKLTQALTRMHGEPVRPENMVDRFLWNGPSVDILLTYDEAAGGGKAFYLYEPIQLEAELTK